MTPPVVSSVSPDQGPTAGGTTVTVTTPGGTSSPADPNAFFHRAAPPSPASVAPASGPAGGGAMVTLTRRALPGATAVRFGGVPASSFTVISATRVTAVTPVRAAGAAAVTVTTPGGTGNPVGHVHLDAPSLVSLVPTARPAAGGAVLTPTGAGPGTTTDVRFGSVSPSFTVVSATQVTAVVPPGPAVPVSVTATTPAGTSNGLTYSRVVAPEI